MGKRLRVFHSMFIFFFGFTCYLFFPASVSALGITPGQIDLENILVGTTVTKQIIVSRPNSDYAEDFRLVLDKSDPAITFSISEIHLKEGETNTSAIVSVHPLTPTKPGEKKQSTISFVPVTNKKISGNAVSVGVTATLVYSATMDSIEKTTIEQLNITPPTENGPASVRFYVSNQGNIPYVFKKVTVHLVSEENKDHGYDIAAKEKQNQLEIAPKMVELFQKSFAITDEPGKYRAYITIIGQDDRVIYTSGPSDFVVRGDNPQAMRSVTKVKNNNWTWLLFVALVPIGLSLYMLTRKGK